MAERFRASRTGDRAWDDVCFVATGAIEPEHLAKQLKRYVERTGLHLEDTGDFVIDAANAIEASEWESRWPKRPGWLFARLHGRSPFRYSRG